MLKQGQKLVSKDGQRKYHIGGVCGEVYLLVNEKINTAFYPVTESELRKHYDIIEEDWEPEEREKYYYRTDCGYVGYSDWTNYHIDIFRRDNLGIYRTEAEVPSTYPLKKASV